MNCITPEVLLESGYKEYRHHEPACDYSLYQRVVTGPEGARLYYINFYFWEFSRVYPQAVKGISVEANVHLYPHKGDTMTGGRGFDLNLHLEATATLDQVEAFYARAYSGLGCEPDWYNQ